MITVSLALAMICFNGQCHPALVGPGTPTGLFPLVHYQTKQQGYGGDILVFKETDHSLYAIHRVYTLNPKQQRIAKLTSGTATQRQSITDGCVNVMPDVYQALMDCCSNQPLEIK